MINRVAVLVLFAALLASAAASAQEPWATLTGDDPRWSSPQFDDSSWPRVVLQSTWREQGRAGYDGIVWFRAPLALGDRHKNELGVMLGPPQYGGYEVYAGGALIGR